MRFYTSSPPLQPPVIVGGPADQAALLEAGEGALQNRIMEMKKEKQYSLSFKNALVKEERIEFVMSQILQERIENRKDIKNGIDIHFTDLFIKRDPSYRNRQLGHILADLQANRDHSRYYQPILTSIRDFLIVFP